MAIKLLARQLQRFKQKNILCYATTTDTSPLIQTNQNQVKPLSTPLIDRENFNEVYLQPEMTLDYKRGSRELFRLETVIEAMQNNASDIPIVIDGKNQTSKHVKEQLIPHQKSHKLARYFHASDQQLFKAIDIARNAQKDWDQVSLAKRIDILEKTARLLSSKYRAELVAATMLGHGKVVAEAEQDAGADLIDVLRMNAQFAKLVTQWQPLTPSMMHGVNHLILHGLEGFVGAICSFNSMAYAANLVITPLLMGNSIVWRPHDSTIMSSWIIYKSLLEAGLPENVISFCPSDETLFCHTITHSEFLSGINYAGNAATFKKLWKLVAKYLEYFHNFPRLSGDCGGRNFHFVHESADPSWVLECTLSAAFEYSGQKRTSCSRLYVPQTMWDNELKDDFVEKLKTLRVGDVTDVDVFMSAVIDSHAFSRLMALLENLQRNPKFRLIAGGKYSGNKGYFVHPTILQCTDIYDRIFKDDYCGPILVVYVYKESDLPKIVNHVANMSAAALAGSVFAKDEQFLKSSVEQFKNCAGNLFLNDKTTTMAFGQQPYGGTRMCGTNDKVGSPYSLLRWTNMQTLRENYYLQT